MRARVRTDDGEHSGWQGSVLSPLLFNIFFATVIQDTLAPLSEGQETVQDLVHLEEDLEEDVVGANSDPLACVRRAVWGMRYADDAGIVASRRKALPR